MGLGRIFDPVLHFTGFAPIPFPVETPERDTTGDGLIRQVEELLEAESNLKQALAKRTCCARDMIRYTNLLTRAQETRHEVYQSEEWKAAWSRTC